MADPISCMEKLDQYAIELEELSRKLAQLERTLEPVEDEYTAFVDHFDLGLWARHEADGAKLPPAAMRLKLAHQAMAPDLLGRYVALVHSRKRMQARIDSLCKAISAQQSILKALRGEMAGSDRGPAEQPVFGRRAA